jgi:hypothetical protein
MPENDAALVGMLAKSWNLKLVSAPADSAANVTLNDEPPAGVLSYLSCEYEQMFRMFSHHSIGFGESVPLYQRVESDAVPPYLYDFPLCGIFSSPLSEAAAMSILLSINRNCDLTEKQRTLMKRLVRSREQKDWIVRIGTAICRENDYASLLELILAISREVTGADAGCIYIRTRMVDGVLCDTLQFALAQSDSFAPGNLKDIFVDINPESLIGYAAHTGRFVEIEDAGGMPEDSPYKSDNEFIRKHDYKCQSVLAVPLKNPENEVVAVLELVNKKPDKAIILKTPENVRKHVLPFTGDDISVVQLLARYAAVSLDRISVYKDAQRQA